MLHCKRIYLSLCCSVFSSLMSHMQLELAALLLALFLKFGGGPFLTFTNTIVQILKTLRTVFKNLINKNLLPKI